MYGTPERIKQGKVIVLHDEVNERVMGTYDTSNVQGGIPEYDFYYHGGYENYIKELHNKGATLLHHYEGEDYVTVQVRDTLEDLT